MENEYQRTINKTGRAITGAGGEAGGTRVGDSEPRQELTPLQIAELRHERNPSLAATSYQLIGHAATGGNLCNKMHKLPSDRRWWCGWGEG